MNKWLFSAGLLLLTSVSALAQEGITFKNVDWTEALEQSAIEGKPVFLEAYATWSEPCQILEDYAFSDDNVASFYNENFISIRVDMENFPGVELAEIYAVTAYPTLLFLTEKGEVLHRGCGALNGEQLLELGKEALGESNLLSFTERFKAGERSTDFLVNYSQLLEVACLDRAELAETYFKETPTKDWINETSWTMINLNVTDPYSDPFQYLIAYHDMFALKYGKDTVDGKIYHVLLDQFIDIYEERDITLFATQALRSMIAKIDFNQKEQLSALVDLKYADLTEKWDLFADNAVRVVEEQQVEDPDQLNEFAWKFYLFVTDPAHLSTARGWMEQVLKDYPDATYLDTYASLLYKTGNQKEAVKFAQKALQAAELEEQDLMHYQAQLEKFETGM